MTARIGERIDVPIKVSSSVHLSLGFAHIAIATNNSYIYSRDGGVASGTLIDWDDVTFRNPVYNTPPGYTSQSLLGFYDLIDGPNPPYDPYNAEIIGYYYMTVVNNSNLIGQTLTVFAPGSEPANGTTLFGDYQGEIEYSNISFHFYQITFIASYTVGTGYGLHNNYQSHIDSYGNSATDYRLEDVTRRANLNPHGHNGQMRDDPGIAQSIKTYRYDNGYPYNLILDTDNNWNASNQYAGVDAHVFAGLIYDYWLSEYNQNSFDNDGSSMLSTIDDPSYPDNSGYNIGLQAVRYGTPVNNAYSWAGCIEGVAHEWAHGITFTQTDPMQYVSEAGAVIESFSNMMGITMKWVYNGRPQSIDWNFGSNVHSPEYPTIRMDDPHAANAEYHRPDFYQDSQDWYSGSDNNVFAHTNAGVMDKMFYFLAAGGVSIHNSVAVQGIGMEEAMCVLYTANTRHWRNPTNNFIKARQWIIEAARLDLGNRDWAIEAANACNAVGVQDNCVYIPGDANNNGETNGFDVTYLVNVLKGISPPLNTCDLPYQDPVPWTNFYAAADYNGDCIINGMDVTYAADYFKGRQPDIKWCPHYTPGNP